MLEIIDTIAVGANPSDVTASPDGSRIYVANTDGGSVSVIDTSTENVTATIGFATANSHPLSVVAHPDGTRVYVGLIGGRVSVIDTASHVEVSEFFVGGGIPALAIHPDGSRLYASLVPSDGTASGDVAVIDTASEVVTAQFTLANSVAWPAVSPDGSRVYFPDYVGHTVAVVDTATYAVEDAFIGADTPIRLAVTPDGNRLYATNATGTAVSVIDVGTGSLLATIPVAGLQQFGIAITPDGKRVYVPHLAGAVSVIDTVGNTVVETLSGVGTRVAGLAVAAGHLYAANPVESTVTVIAPNVPLWHGRLPKLTGKLVGGVAAGGGGGLVIGRHIFKVPPHTPAGLNVEGLSQGR